MNVTITLIICLSVVFVFTLGIVSSTLRDQNFKVRFDDRNRRLMRIIAEQRDELHSYREAIKKNDANLERSLNVLASASDAVNSKISRLKDTEELLASLKAEIADFTLGQDKSSKKMDEAIRSFSSCAKSIEHENKAGFKWLDERLVMRPSHLSPEEKKNFMEFMQASSKCYKSISKLNMNFVSIDDVKVLSFRKLVSAMRTTEKEYWAHRDKKMLRQSIELEKRVDGIIMKADGNDVPQNDNGTFFLLVAELRASTIQYFQEKKKPQPDNELVNSLFKTIKETEAKLDKMLIRLKDEQIKKDGYIIQYHVMERMPRAHQARSIFNSSDEQLANIELNDHYRHPDPPGTMYFICKKYLGKDGKQLPQEEVDKIINNNLNS